MRRQHEINFWEAGQPASASRMKLRWWMEWPVVFLSQESFGSVIEFSIRLRLAAPYTLWWLAPTVRTADKLDSQHKVVACCCVQMVG